MQINNNNNNKMIINTKYILQKKLHKSNENKNKMKKQINKEEKEKKIYIIFNISKKYKTQSSPIWIIIETNMMVLF